MDVVRDVEHRERRKRSSDRIGNLDTRHFSRDTSEHVLEEWLKSLMNFDPRSAVRETDESGDERLAPHQLGEMEGQIK